MAYPNLQYPIDVNSGTYRTYEDASSTWCDRRRKAKGRYRAYQLMLEWGLARNEGEKCFDAHCSLFNKNREYCISSSIINSQEARRLAEEVGGSKEVGCEIIENFYGEALTQKKNAEDMLGTANGAAKDNLQIALEKWTLVADWTRAFDKFQGGTYEDGTEMDTCDEEGLESLYDDAANDFKKKIDAEGAPLPNSLLIGIVGVSTLLLGFLIYKITK